MDLNQLAEHAVAIRDAYAIAAKKNNKQPWSNAQVMEGFVGDVGDLMKLIMAKEGIRDDIQNIDEKITHELSDCLYVILVLAKEYNIDLEKSFVHMMAKLNSKITHDSNR